MWTKLREGRCDELMARSRVIKPEFWTDEKIGGISRDSKLLFIGLWCLSDDYGVVRANEKYIKGQLFPYDDCQATEIRDWLSALERKELIIKFNSNGESYYCIRTFTEHQKIHNPSKTRNPVPPKSILGKIPRNSEEFVKSRLETETETELKQKLYTEYKLKTETITTTAPSDEKTHRLVPKENESFDIQPDVPTGLPVETTQDVLSELPARIMPDVPTGLPAEARDALTEPSLGHKQDVITELPVNKGDAPTKPSSGQEDEGVDGTAQPLPQNKKIYFNYEIVKFANITDSHVVRWKEAYPAVDVLTELRQMEVWADTNRKNRKSNWQRFIVNWLKRSQDRARPISPSWKGGEFGRFGNSKPTHVGETENLKGKYADQVDEVIYTDA